MSFALIRSKGRAVTLGDGGKLSPKMLRGMIPVDTLLALQVDAALSGKLRQIDTETGEEIAPARPLDPETQLKIIDKLVDKRLPSVKVVDEPTLDNEARGLNPDDLPSDPEDVKRMTMSQINKAIEAKFTIIAETQHAEPELPSSAGPRAGNTGADEQGGGAGAADQVDRGGQG